MVRNHQFDQYVAKFVPNYFHTLEKKADRDVEKNSRPSLSIITQFFPPDYAATGQLLSELVTQLRNLGMNIHLFTGQPGYAFDKDSAPTWEISERLSIRRSRTSRIWPRRIRGRVLNGLLFSLRAILHLCKKSNRGEVLLITTEPPYLTFLGYIAHLLFGIPYVCLLYDVYPDIAVNLNVISEKHWIVQFWNWLNRLIWTHADGIIVLSSTMKEKVLAQCPDIQEKVKIVHSWADPNWIKPIQKEHNWFAHKFDLVKPFTVMYSGNMGRCHDLNTIIDAAVYLQDQPIQFVFIGAGAKQKECVAKIQQLGLTNCRFLPYQDRDILPYSLSACDLSLVSVDRGMEGLVAPSKLYGIMATGRPVAIICESHSYLRQLVKDAKCGQSFEPGDSEALAKYIQDLAIAPHLVQEMGKAGRAYLQAHFTPEIIAKKYFQILKHAALNRQ
jgi:glycosyltransferase involved in cell wall biosynthesis